jgi:hypothetical protein
MVSTETQKVVCIPVQFEMTMPRGAVAAFHGNYVDGPIDVYVWSRDYNTGLCMREIATPADALVAALRHHASVYAEMETFQ